MPEPKKSSRHGLQLLALPEPPLAHHSLAADFVDKFGKFVGISRVLTSISRNPVVESAFIMAATLLSFVAGAPDAVGVWGFSCIFFRAKVRAEA